MTRKTGSVLLIASGCIIAILYGVLTASGIMSMIEDADFVTNFAETLISLLVFAGGVIEIIVGVSDRKRKGALSSGAVALLITAIIFSLIGAALVGLNSSAIVLITALIGTVVPIVYLITIKKR